MLLAGSATPHIGARLKMRPPARETVRRQEPRESMSRLWLREVSGPALARAIELGEALK